MFSTIMASPLLKADTAFCKIEIYVESFDGQG
jgi:hypothetical protein